MSTQSTIASSPARPSVDRRILAIVGGVLIAVVVVFGLIAIHQGADPNFPTDLPVWQLGVGYP